MALTVLIRDAEAVPNLRSMGLSRISRDYLYSKKQYTSVSGHAKMKRPAGHVFGLLHAFKSCLGAEVSRNFSEPCFVREHIFMSGDVCEHSSFVWNLDVLGYRDIPTPLRIYTEEPVRVDNPKR